jgi:hypothetical protein
MARPRIGHKILLADTSTGVYNYTLEMGMTYRGHFKNGQVVLDEAAQIPDGTPVTVDVGVAASNDASAPDEQSLSKLLLSFAGVVQDMPSDFARNHDHYIHGQPKK